MTSILSSLASAASFVDGAIQLLVRMRSAIASFRFATSPSIFALALGGKYFAAYSRPPSSPRLPSTRVSPRFHRGRCPLTPLRSLVKSTWLSTNAFNRYGADFEETWKHCPHSPAPAG